METASSSFHQKPTGKTYLWLFPEARSQERESFIKCYWKPNSFGKLISFQVNQILDNVIKYLFIQRASSTFFFMGKTDIHYIYDLITLLLKR